MSDDVAMSYPRKILGVASTEWSYRGKAGYSEAIFGGVDPDVEPTLDSPYRFRLSRIWDAARPALTFVGLNPSTATHEKDDPTIRRILGFAMDWGFGKLVMLNLFAFRSTDPRGLYSAAEPLGTPTNGEFLVHAFERARGSKLVLGWGTHGAWYDHGRRVGEIARDVHGEPHCFGRTKSGEPMHPLYIRADAKTIAY